MRKKYAVLLIFIFLAGFISPGFSAEENQRVISLAPHITEIIFALGAGDKLVGVTTYCDYPEKAKTIEKAGSFSQPNIEKILSLTPDIVFMATLEQAQAVEKLKQLGLRVVVLDPSSLDELFKAIYTIGGLLGKTQEAEALVGEMKAKIDNIKKKAEGIHQDKKIKVFIEIWNDPITTAGRGSFIDELIGLAGGINIAYDAPRAYSRFPSELIIERNPDCIILGYMGGLNNRAREHEQIKKRLGWQKINAVKNDRIYDDIDPNIFLRPGPRLAEGLEEIYKRLYGD